MKTIFYTYESSTYAEAGFYHKNYFFFFGGGGIFSQPKIYSWIFGRLNTADKS